MVCALHERVLEHVDAELRFTPDAVEAEDAVRNREAVAAFFLPPTDAARIRDVIDRGERLPRKSTFFWPKPRTGLVLDRSTSTRPSELRSQSNASTGSSFLMPAAITSVRLRAPAPLR